MIRFVRDADGDLYIEIPGRPERFALAHDFGRGAKYVERYSYSLEEIEGYGPVTYEWGTGPS